MGIVRYLTGCPSGLVLHSLLVLALCLTPCAAFRGLATASAQDELGGEGSDVQSLLKQAFSQFAQGDNNAAVALFEKALAQNPTNDAIFDFIQELTFAEIYRMVGDPDPRISGIGTQLIKDARIAQRRMIEDGEAVRSAVNEVLSNDAEEQLKLLIRHTHTYGRNLVPALVPVLGDKEIEKRTLAFRWIHRIGLDALPPLVAAWQHPEPRIRMNIARLLGVRVLRHPFSMAYLKAMVETDDHREIRETANASLEAIRADFNGSGSVREANVQFLSNAVQFYREPYTNPFKSPKYSATVYSLVGGTVVGEKVAPFQLSERMAMQALAEARALDPDYAPVHVLDVVNDAAQLVEYDENVVWYANQGGHEEIKEILARQKGYMDYVLRLRVLAAPARILYAALRQAGSDERADVAHYLVRTILEKEHRGTVPTSLVEALRDEKSRLVRIAAAITLAYWNPADGFTGGEQVISVLSSTVVQSGVRTIVKGMGNQALANYFDGLFRDLGHESLVHVKDAALTIMETEKSPPDLLLLDTEIRIAAGKEGISPINRVVTELRNSYRTANVPVLVAVEPSAYESAKDAYESEERKVWVIPQNIQARELREGMLDPLFSGKDDAKSLATRLASEAAKALEYLASVRTELPVENAIEGLSRVLANRADEVRIPCIRALGDLKASAVVEELAQVFENDANADEVREAAMLSVAKVLQGAPGGAPESVLNVILQGTRQSNLTLRRAAWIAFSSSGAAPEEYRKLLLSLPPEGAETASEVATPEGVAVDTAGSETELNLDLDRARGDDAKDN